MEVEILENTKTRISFELKGESHTFCNILKEEIWNDDSVRVSSYNINHPLVGFPHFIIETNGKKSAIDAVKDAVKRLEKDAEKVKKAASSAIK